MFNKDIKFRNDFIEFSYKDTIICILASLLVTVFTSQHSNLCLLPITFGLCFIACVIIITLIRATIIDNANKKEVNGITHLLCQLYPFYLELEKNLSKNTYAKFKSTTLALIPSDETTIILLKMLLERKDYRVTSSAWKKVLLSIKDSIVINFVFFSSAIATVAISLLDNTVDKFWTILLVIIIMCSKIWEDYYNNNKMIDNKDTECEKRMIKVILQILSDKENENKNISK